MTLYGITMQQIYSRDNTPFHKRPKTIQNFFAFKLNWPLI